jgi:5'-methylthioadenosine phosphorylase
MTDECVAGVIGGTGFTQFLTPLDSVVTTTPYGPTSAPITICDVDGRRVAFLPRHGTNHQHAPHRVNYRANLWALKELGVGDVFAPFAAGALDSTLDTGDLVIPDQLVDRTWGRADTYHDDFASGVVHASFADPYSDTLRSKLIQAAHTVGLAVRERATVVVIQGPRFGTRAESDWYAAQGWHLVNMTQYPEAVLARELELRYAGIAIVTDSDSGESPGSGVTQEEVFAAFDHHLDRLRRLLVAAIQLV